MEQAAGLLVGKRGAVPHAGSPGCKSASRRSRCSLWKMTGAARRYVVVRSRQRQRQVASASKCAAAEEAGQEGRKFPVEGPGGPGSRPSGRRAQRSPFLLSGTPPSVCVWGVCPGSGFSPVSPHRTRRLWAGAGPGGQSVAPGSGVGWHRAPDRRGPRGPLFPLHVARFLAAKRGEKGREEEELLP